MFQKHLSSTVVASKRLEYPKSFDYVDIDKLSIEDCLFLIEEIFYKNKDSFVGIKFKQGIRYFANLIINKKLAKLFLKVNISNNRKLYVQDIPLITQNINNDNWRSCNGEILRFLFNFALGDGQHRLTGFLLSDKDELEILISYNYEIDDILTIDGGRNRSLIDQMRLSGLSDIGDQQKKQEGFKQTLKYIHCYNRNIPADKFKCSDKTVKLDINIMYEYIKITGLGDLIIKPAFENAWKSIINIKRGVIPIIAMAHYATYQKYGENSHKFFYDLQNTWPELPINDVRNILAKFLSSFKEVNGNHRKIEYAIFKAYYYWNNNNNSIPMDEISTFFNISANNNNSDPLEIANYRPNQINK